ncbi:MAG: hypothetical protein EHM19_03735, partial [Candidatus Latescibacterota bacterium]
AAAAAGVEANPMGIPVVARHYLTAGRDDWARSEWRGFGRLALLVGVGAGALALLARGERGRRAAAGILLAAVAADGWTFARSYYTPQPRDALFAPDESLEPLRSGDDPFRVARFTWEYLLPPNTGVPYGIEDLQGVNALLSREYGDLFLAVDPVLHPDGRRVAPFRSAEQLALPLWDLLGVRYFLLSPPRPRGGGAPADPDRAIEGIAGLRVAAREPFVLVENTEALPRAFLRHAHRVEKDRSRILREVTSPAFDAAGPIWLEADPNAPSGDPAVLPGDSCAVLAREGSTLVVHSRSDASALLFVSETWFPGWEATVDGEPRPILRADYAFRAVALPPGEHEIVFRYRPASFRIGAALSAVSLVLLLLLAVRARRSAPARARADLSR